LNGLFSQLEDKVFTLLGLARLYS